MTPAGAGRGAVDPVRPGPSDGPSPSEVLTRAALLCLTLLLAACAEKPPAAPTAPGPVTLMELQNGDGVCYVIVTRPSGEELNDSGSFELCRGGSADASALIGKEVTLTIGRERILGASCQGDPECRVTEEVDLVTAVAASP